MPTYEYECIECGHRFDAFQNMSDDPLKECEHCKGPVRRLISGGTGIIFKGSGFYVNDNKGKKSAVNDPASTDKTEKADEKKPSDEKKSEKTESSAAESKSSSKKEPVTVK